MSRRLVYILISIVLFGVLCFNRGHNLHLMVCNNQIILEMELPSAN
jgi:hypothetical protein